MGYFKVGLMSVSACLYFGIFKFRADCKAFSNFDSSAEFSESKSWISRSSNSLSLELNWSFCLPSFWNWLFFINMRSLCWWACRLLLALARSWMIECFSRLPVCGLARLFGAIIYSELIDSFEARWLFDTVDDWPALLLASLLMRLMALSASCMFSLGSNWSMSSNSTLSVLSLSRLATFALSFARSSSLFWRRCKFF